MAPSCFEVILVGFILVLPFLYETSRTFRYYFKFLIYYGVVMMIAVVLMPILSLRPGNIKNFLRVLTAVADRGGDGHENLLTDARCLFCQWVAVMMMVVFVVVAASIVNSSCE